MYTNVSKKRDYSMYILKHREKKKKERKEKGGAKKAQNKRWKSRHNSNYNQLKGQNILFERSENKSQ